MKAKTSTTSLEEQVVENLRRVYQEKASEAVPDRFLELLKQLKNQENPDALS
ncbi:MAG: NepR family anti-sigma factor [bacterium]